MPRIPTINAEGAAVENLPQRIPVPSYEIGESGGRALQQFGAQLTNIGQRLQQQQDLLDSQSLIGIYNGKMKELQYSVRTDVPDPMERAKEFTKRASEVTKELSDKAPNKIVGLRFNDWAARHTPLHAAEVWQSSMEFMAETQTAQRRDITDSLIESAAQEPTVAGQEELKSLALGKQTSPGVWEGGLINDDPNLTPLGRQKERRRLLEKFDRDYLNYRSSTSPDTLLSDYEAHRLDKIDPAVLNPVIDRTISQRDERVRRNEVALEKQKKEAAEGLERDFLTGLREGTMSQEWINQNSQYVSSEKYNFWNNTFRDKQYGLKTGNPVVESSLLPDMMSNRIPAESKLATLDRLKAQGQIGTEFYIKYAEQARADIQRKQTEDRVVQSEGEARQREFDRARYASIHQNAERVFKTTGILTWDSQSTTVMTLYLQEVQHMDKSHGGSVDAQQLERELLPKYIIMLDQNTASLLDNIEKILGKTNSTQALNAERSRMSPEEFARRALLLDQHKRISQEKENLRLHKALIEGSKIPTGERLKK